MLPFSSYGKSYRESYPSVLNFGIRHAEQSWRLSGQTDALMRALCIPSAAKVNPSAQLVGISTAGSGPRTMGGISLLGNTQK